MVLWTGALLGITVGHMPRCTLDRVLHAGFNIGITFACYITYFSIDSETSMKDGGSPMPISLVKLYTVANNMV